jgi:predicted nucleic acid-binding protein
VPDDGSRAAVADAGPLIHLDELGCLGILDAFVEVLVPFIVASEAARHRPGGLDRAPPNVHFEDPDPERVREYMRAGALDVGEAAALALWETRTDAVLLCDDLAARRHAERMGCAIAGTLGLLLQAGRTRRLPVETVKELVQSLPTRTTLHIRHTLLAQAVLSLETRDDD